MGSWKALFSSPGQRPCELLPSLGVCQSYVVSFTHFKASYLGLLCDGRLAAGLGTGLLPPTVMTVFGIAALWAGGILTWDGLI
jgi:hypothetical protein